MYSASFDVRIVQATILEHERTEVRVSQGLYFDMLF